MKYSGLFFCSIFFFLSVPGEEKAPSPQKNEPEHFYFKESFQEDFHNLFEMLAAEYPELLKELNPKDVDRALTAVLKAVNSGIEPAAGKAPAKKKNPEKTPLYPRLRLSGNLIYLRLDTVDPQTIGELEKAFGEKSGGVILDLRSCSSGSYQSVSKMFNPYLKRPLPHLAILTSAKTEGAAEILAELLVRNRKGIRIGEATAGAPYFRKTVTVSTRKWLIPRPPPGAETVRYGKMPPQIPAGAFPRLAYDKLKTLKQPDSGDRALSRAADLLVSLDLLDKKGLKK